MDIHTYLAQGSPLLFDGAMGTCFASFPGHTNHPSEPANLTAPNEVLNIHRAYLNAGCKALKTNTFAVSAMLACGDDSAQGIVEAGCRLAADAAENRAYIFADIGPVPQEHTARSPQIFIRQGEWFLAQGITHFLMETLSVDDGVADFAHWLKSTCPEAFLLVSFAVDHSGVTSAGRLGRDLYSSTAALDEIDAVGFNCVSSPHHLLKFIQTLPLSSKPLSVMPNAGYPVVLGRRTVFEGKADYFAQQMLQLVQAGANIVGGCCGTSPEHIRCTAQALRTPLPKIQLRPQQEEDRPRRSSPNSLWEKLDGGQYVLAVELDPPADDDVERFLQGVETLRDAGADAITIADCPIGRPRADSSLLACKIKRELGVEPLPHMTCRDRNLNATKALLLGLSMEGVHNVLLVTGDPIPSEDRDLVKSVFNFNSRKLARFVRDLNDTVLRTPTHIYGALNLNAHNFAVELQRALEKEDCGVEAFLTQPVLSAQALENLILARETLRGKLLGGIFPPVSHRNACFLNHEISGMRVCDEIISLYEGKDRQQAEALAVTISAAIAKEIRPYTDGAYLMTPFRRTGLMQRIIKEIR